MSQAELAKEIAYRMEAKKDGLRQTQTGDVKLTFTIHPQDMHANLYSDPMGQRYVLVAVPIDDNDSPLPPTVNSGPDNSVKAGGKPVTDSSSAGREPRKWGDIPYVEQAGILSQDQRFWRYTQSDSAESAAQAIRLACGVKSRKEILPGTYAGRLFDDLCKGYQDFKFMEGRE